MSLDVYLEGEERQKDCTCFDCGHTHTRTVRNCYFSANITHNLTSMARAAGIYRELWRPDEIGVSKARQLIAPLRDGLEKLGDDPARFREQAPGNGWGTHEGLVEFVRKYLAACELYPDATVRVWR